VLKSSEFQTTGAAVETAREEKTVLTCVVVVVELKPNVNFSLDDTPWFRCKIRRLPSLSCTKCYCCNLVVDSLLNRQPMKFTSGIRGRLFADQGRHKATRAKWFWTFCTLCYSM